MDYHQEFIVDFAKRTKRNLDFIVASEKKGAKRKEEEKGEKEGEKVFEVTQLVNSMLGMLVFPRERYMKQIPDVSLSRLVKDGWPKVEIVEGKFRKKTLRELMRMLRNGISHCNVEFISENRQITGIFIWNECNHCDSITWKAKLSLENLRQITEKFIELIVSEGEISYEKSN